MKVRQISKIWSFILVVLILGVSYFFFMKDDQPFSIIDLMEEKADLNTDEVTGITLKKVDEESNTTHLTPSETEKLIEYLDATIIKKSKEDIEQIGGMYYMLILYTDENAVEYGRSKRLLLKNVSDKTYIQLIGTGEYTIYEADYNGTYELIKEYLSQQKEQPSS